MTALLWRVVIAVIVVVFFYLIFPLLLSVLKLSIPADAMRLIQLCIACIAVLYVLFGPKPPVTPLG